MPKTTVLLVMLCAVSPAFGGEKEVLKTFEQIKSHVEAGVNYNKFSTLLAEAKLQINGLSGNKKKPSQAFVFAIKNCYESYRIAKRALITQDSLEEAIHAQSQEENALHVSALNEMKQNTEQAIQSNFKDASRHLTEAYKHKK